MDKYVTPSLRTKTEKPIIETSEKSFPMLGEYRKSKNVMSYSEQAEEWKQQRIQKEIEYREEAEMVEMMKKHSLERKEEDKRLLDSSPFKNRKVQKQDIQKAEAKITADDGWTLVQKKPRHVRKDKVNFDEVPEDAPISSDEDEHAWVDDKDSIWN